MGRQWCCCVDNVMGSLIVAIVELVVFALWLIDFLVVKSAPNTGYWHWGMEVALLVGAVCLLIGALKKMPLLILIFVIVTAVAVVLAAIVVVTLIIDGYFGRAFWQFICLLALQVWFMLIAWGAREDLTMGGQGGTV